MLGIEPRACAYEASTFELCPQLPFLYDSWNARRGGASACEPSTWKAEMRGLSQGQSRLGLRGKMDLDP